MVTRLCSRVLFLSSSIKKVDYYNKFSPLVEQGGEKGFVFYLLKYKDGGLPTISSTTVAKIRQRSQSLNTLSNLSFVYNDLGD